MAKDDDLNGIVVSSQRLSIKAFTPEDALDVFSAITPSLTRFMSWEPPVSAEAFAEVWRAWLPRIADGTDLHLVVRSAIGGEFLGIVGLHGIAVSAEPELGIWIKEAAQGFGYGREAMSALIAWASRRFGITSFVWPAAEENLPSRRLAESLNGVVIGSRGCPKYTALIYRVPAALTE